MRHAHKLKGNMRQEVWREIYGVALGGDGMQHANQASPVGPGPWVIYGGRMERGGPLMFRGDSAHGLIDAIGAAARPKQRAVFVTVDLYALVRYLDGGQALTDAGWQVTRYWFAEARKGAYIQAKRGAQSILLLDLLNYFRDGDAEISTLLGEDAPKDAEERGGQRSVGRDARQRAQAYYHAFRDWQRFLADNDLGNPARTLAGQAFNAFRHRFMGHDIYLHTLHYVDRLERDAYHGGWNECLYRGEVERYCYLLDINSSYPYVMRSGLYPTKLVAHEVGHFDLKALYRRLKTYAAIARVDLEIDQPHYLVRHLDRLIRPVGQFTTVLTTPDLKRALEAAEVVRVHEVALYEQAPLFREFVTWGWETRRKHLDEGNPTWAYLAKILLNSLYGKFGQRQRTVAVDRTCDPRHFDSGLVFRSGECYLQWRAFGREQWFSMSEWTSFNAFPAVAAHVTAYARQTLADYLWQAGPDNVYYVDTDSLLVNAAGFGNLRTHLGPNLGQLKVVAEGNGATVRDIKDYDIGGRSKRKGVPQEAVWDKVEQAWAYREAIGFRGALSHADRRGQGDREVRKRIYLDKDERGFGVGWQHPQRLG